MRTLYWTARRVPELPDTAVSWGKRERLFDGRTLHGWTWRWGHERSWAVRSGSLVSAQQEDDLATLQHYMNFRLHLRYRLGRHQDSGVHLRGRYEIQLTDRDDTAGPEGITGAVYGRAAPRVSAQHAAGRWNTLDLELVGSRLTAKLNGRVIRDHVRLAGITGDALDSQEGEPGPIMLQGHCGLVEFRDIVITPAL